MKKLYLPNKLVFIFLLSSSLFFSSCFNTAPREKKSNSELIEEREGDEGKDAEDGPDKIADLELLKTQDPSTGFIPREKYLIALQKTIQSRNTAPLSVSSFGVWSERGPVSDLPGPSNGNTRGNNDFASGRVRAILVDAGDASGKTVFIGSVAGGLWKTTDITTRPATWTLVNDFLANLAITDICQDPTNSNTMYFCTGEAFLNADAVSGNGVFKSTDHGVTWAPLASTSAYTTCTRIRCDAAGNVYLGTYTAGLLRSINGGTSWTAITPSGSSARIADFEISSTGRLHVTTGLGNSAIGLYRYTDVPSTVTSGLGWIAPTTAFPYPSGNNCRVELGCSGNTLYALPSNTSANVTTIYKSTDGGDTWAATTTQPTPSGTNWASGQAWYALSCDIDPSNTNNVIVGGLDSYRSLDGGASWVKISIWVNNPVSPLPYVHADIHAIKWYDNGNKLLFGCDGGIHFSSDKGVTIRDRNEGLRIKQFYSCAAHPTLPNYYIAGAQDNGCHQFSNAGLSTTVEITGGDGAMVAIDQQDPTYQFGSYVYNRYRRSLTSGSTWGSVNFFKGTSAAASDFGQFINPFALDNTTNILYCSSSAGEFFRWTDPESLASGSYYQGGSPAWPATAGTVAIPEFNGAAVSNVAVSPYTANTVYFGTYGARVVRVDNANTIVSGTNASNISTGLPAAGTVSCIAVGTDDNNLMVTYSNYNISSVWVTTNGGTSWSSLDANGTNLPDMPVRWCMFVPGSNNTQAILATETGVWLTQAINTASPSSTVWINSPTFPVVRTDMLAYRPLDNTVAAATHGRGLWTQNVYTIIPVNDFTLRAKWLTKETAELNWEFSSLTAGTKFTVEASYDGQHFDNIGAVDGFQSSTTYRFNHMPVQSKVFYRIKSTSINGAVKYSNQVVLSKNGAGQALEISKLFPNPVKNELKAAFTIAGKGKTVYALTSLTGQTIWRKEENLDFTGNYIRSWDVSNLPKGTYTLTISSNTEKATQKFVKQ